MRHLILLSMAITCYFGTYHAADDAQYIVSPYNDARDHTEAFDLISSNFDKLCTRPDKQKIDPMEQKRVTRRHAVLQNHTHWSPVIVPLENKFFRIVLRDENKLIGFADFFENAIDHDSLKKHDGYCETLLTIEGHAVHYPTLIATALKQCKEIGLKRFVHHLVNNQLYDLPEYKALITAGFAAKEQTDFEKKYNVVRLEKEL